MRTTTLLLTALASASFTQTSPAATITASSDSRYAFVAIDSGGVPIFAESAAGITFPLYQMMDFDECMWSGTWQSCLDVSARYTGLGPNNTVQGLTANGAGAAWKSIGFGTTIASAQLAWGLTISDLPPGQKIPFSWKGHFETVNGTCHASIDGPGIDITIDGEHDWDEIIWLGAGEYSVNITSEVGSSEITFYTGQVAFSATLEATNPLCTSAAESCYLIHPSSGCDEVVCCNTICDLDPHCCTASWDAQCVWQAANQCAPPFITGDVPNPLNGHRYRLTKPLMWADAPAYLAAAGYEPVAISNGQENAWLRSNVASNVPGLPAFNPTIGLNDLAQEGNFVWANGDAITYTNWSPGEPNGGNAADSVQLFGTTGRWGDISSYEMLMAIGEESMSQCGAGGGAGSCFTMHAIPGCNDESCCNEVCLLDDFCCTQGWDGVCVGEATSLCSGATTGPTVPNPTTGHRYVAVTAGSWLQAERLALALGGHLASIDDAAENAWIVANFLSLPGSPSELFIGLNDHAVEGAFRWVSHEPADFTTWAPGEPNNWGGDEDVAILRPNGLWNDIPGSLARFALIEIPCTGDLDSDGLVGGADLAVLLGAWGGASIVADMNVDGIVDGADLAMLLGAWGPCPTSNACTEHGGTASDQPGCTACVCGLDSFCCEVTWDSICAGEAIGDCDVACQCGG
jgi:hypothetical protein